MFEWNVYVFSIIVSGKHFRSLAYKHQSMHDWLLDHHKTSPEGIVDAQGDFDKATDLFAIGFEELVDLNTSNIISTRFVIIIIHWMLYWLRGSSTTLYYLYPEVFDRKREEILPRHYNNLLLDSHQNLWSIFGQIQIFFFKIVKQKTHLQLSMTPQFKGILP